MIVNFNFYVTHLIEKNDKVVLLGALLILQKFGRKLRQLLQSALQSFDHNLLLLQLGQMLPREVKVLVNRQSDGKLGEVALFGVERDEAAQLRDQVLGDVQAQADSFFVDGPVLLHDLAKELEHVLLVLRADSDSRVEDLELHRVHKHHRLRALLHSHLGLLGADLDVSLEGELRRVAQDVNQNLLQTLVVALDLAGRILGHRLDEEYVLLEPQLHINKLEDLIYELGHVDRLVIHFEFAGLELGEVEGVIDKREEEA